MIKKLFRYSLFLIVPGLIYGAAIGVFYWRWMIPHDEMPAGISEAGNSQVYAEKYEDLARGFEKMIAERRAITHAPSISAAVSVDGETVWAGAAGFANVEEKIPADISSQYRIGSTSKALTAVAMMKLVEEGRLDLEQNIQAYLQDWTNAALITPQMLASHMSGIRHYRAFDPLRWPPSDGLSTTNYARVTDSLAEFKDDPLLFAPGSNFSYSTYGFVLLSAVMEAAADEDFLEIIQSRIIHPLGMTTTIPENAGQPAANMVGFYTSGEGVYGPTYPIDNSYKWAGGGFLSTPGDLVKLGIALLGDDYLSAEARATMFKRQLMPSGEDNPQYYALGWRHYETSLIFSENDKIDVIHHGGTSAGGASFFMLVPDYNIAISILSNSASGDIRPEIQTLAYEMVGRIIAQQRQGEKSEIQARED